jgi:polyisoprenoid-binding protein YceI
MATWQLDTAHTVVSFTGKHMMITKVRGIFKGVTGTIEFDAADPAASRVEVVIPAAAVETGMEPRDNHLRSADFLDVETYPTLTFVSTGIAPKGDRWAITGDLTIRGVTRPVVLDTEALGIVTGMDGRRHAGFEATTRIKRSEWGLTWNVGLEAGGWLVSDDVVIELEVAADEVAPVAARELVGAASAPRTWRQRSRRQ